MPSITDRSQGGDTPLLISRLHSRERCEAKQAVQLCNRIEGAQDDQKYPMQLLCCNRDTCIKISQHLFVWLKFIHWEFDECFLTPSVVVQPRRFIFLLRVKDFYICYEFRNIIIRVGEMDSWFKGSKHYFERLAFLSVRSWPAIYVRWLKVIDCAENSLIESIHC